MIQKKSKQQVIAIKDIKFQLSFFFVILDQPIFDSDQSDNETVPNEER